jgi:hypothetical protein
MDLREFLIKRNQDPATKSSLLYLSVLVILTHWVFISYPSNIRLGCSTLASIKLFSLLPKWILENF